jgi:hypothetical protein
MQVSAGKKLGDVPEASPLWRAHWTAKLPAQFEDCRNFPAAGQAGGVYDWQGGGDF